MNGRRAGEETSQGRLLKIGLKKEHAEKKLNNLTKYGEITLNSQQLSKELSNNLNNSPQTSQPNLSKKRG